MDRKTYRAQETRWRFLAITGYDGKCFNVEMANRTEAKRFAEWLTGTGTARRANLVDKNGNDSGYGWATMKKYPGDPFEPKHVEPQKSKVE